MAFVNVLGGIWHNKARVVADISGLSRSTVRTLAIVVDTDMIQSPAYSFGALLIAPRTERQEKAKRAHGFVRSKFGLGIRHRFRLVS
jgi:hypothetical protein